MLALYSVYKTKTSSCQKKRTSRIFGGLELHLRRMWGGHRPEPDAGVRTAYVFSKPHGCEEMTAGLVRVTPPPYLLPPRPPSGMKLF